MELPEGFSARMQGLLGDEYDAFLKSYERERIQGLRVNTLRVSPEEFLQISPFVLEPVPWAAEGFYYPREARPGKHPYHEAGLYYIQEPSAMSAAALLDPQPGERVLDLCAAPGGKSTQLAARMCRNGLLVANEIHPARAKILSQNIERMGIPNALVLNETPARLAQRFPGFFDRVLVDAPCSGEGMFRKEPEALAQWSMENVRLCAERQLEILSCAAAMLRPGGRLAYSTCTFAPEENEGTVSAFLRRFPEFEVERARGWEGFAPGRPDWIQDGDPRAAGTFRLWPHRLKGEGHYAALLRKAGDAPAQDGPLAGPADRKLLGDYFQFERETLAGPVSGEFLLFGDQLYRLGKGLPRLDGLKVLRPGLHLGTLKKGRFEPSHAMALAVSPGWVRKRLELGADDPRTLAYLRGETLDADGQKGWTLVTVDGFGLGWGKQSGGQLKNHFPKGLRWLGL